MSALQSMLVLRRLTAVLAAGSSGAGGSKRMLDEGNSSMGNSNSSSMSNSLEGSWTDDLPLVAPEMGIFEQISTATVVIGDVVVPVADLVVTIVGVLWVLFVMVRAARMSRVSSTTDGSAIVLLPVYMQLFRITAFAVVARAVLGTFAAVYVYPAESIYDLLGYYIIYTCLNGLSTAVYRVPTEGLAFFLFQHTAGTRAVKRAVAFGVASALVNFSWPTVAQAIILRGRYIDEFTPIPWPAIQEWVDAWFVIVYLWLGGLYFAGWLAPSKWLYRRPALIPFAAFWAFEILLGAIATVLGVWDLDVRFLVVLIQDILYFVLGPPVAYQAMVSDSLFWQGYHPVERSAIGSLIAPLDGIRFTMASTVTLAAQIDQLATTCPVQQLNFRYLKLDNERMLGAGGQARVYRGKYKDRPVAIKVVFCIELTPEIVADFCNEARLLTLMAHPNIVETVGVCVVPPTVAIVMELCERGSLADVLQSDLPMTWRLKLLMCRDCVRGIEFLHSRGAVHQDIKSMNYLVTNDLTVKLTDLGVSNDENAPAQGFRGTLFWGAPEILAGETYTPAADVYSLAIVLWEIAARKFPYDTADVRRLKANQLVEAVRGLGDWESYPSASASDGGLRPPIPVNIPADFVSLLRVGWAASPSVRPTARELLFNLESMIDRLPSTMHHVPHVAKFGDNVDFGPGTAPSRATSQAISIPRTTASTAAQWTTNPLLPTTDTTHASSPEAAV